jgi:nucleotidyltransferase substrate binding protein (TIGR01987 family)
MRNGSRDILFSQLDTWRKALKTFSDVLDMPGNPVVRDASIQRFEYNFELAWKTVKRYSEAEGTIVNSPREAFREAFKLGLFQQEEVWLAMIEDRNRTTHTYNEKTAEEIYLNLRDYLRVMKTLLDAISQRVNFK